MTWRLCVILLSCCLLGRSEAELIAVENGASNLASSSKDSAQKIGGEYKITKIDRDSAGVFHVEFQASQLTGRFDSLQLESDHVHVGVKVGQTYRLSAEILGEAGVTAEVSQVVLFFPGPSGRVPVWLLSKKAIGRDLKAIRYLEMHVPANDFMVM